MLLTAPVIRTCVQLCRRCTSEMHLRNVNCKTRLEIEKRRMATMLAQAFDKRTKYRLFLYRIICIRFGQFSESDYDGRTIEIRKQEKRYIDSAIFAFDGNRGGVRRTAFTVHRCA